MNDIGSALFNTRIYKRLNVSFDQYAGESMYSAASTDVVTRLLQQGLQKLNA